MAEVGVWSGDADGLVGFVGQTGGGAEDRGQDATGDPAGVHLLELQQRLVILWRGGSGHRNNGKSQATLDLLHHQRLFTDSKMF